MLYIVFCFTCIKVKGSSTSLKNVIAKNEQVKNDNMDAATTVGNIKKSSIKTYANGKDETVMSSVIRTRAANIRQDQDQFRSTQTPWEALLYYFGPAVIGFFSIFSTTLVLLYFAFEELPWIALNVCGYYPMGFQSRISLCLFGKYTKKKQPVRAGKSTGTCTSTKGEKTKGVERKRGIGRFVLNPLMLMSLFWASMVSVVNGFTPEDNAAFNSAKSSCLSETPDGSCPTYAASNDATGIPYGVIGDWDMPKVTSLSQSTSTPPLLFCCPLVLSLEFSALTPIAFIFTFSQCSFFWIVSNITRHRHPPTAFAYAYAFNADISKWNTAAVTTMERSKSTPPLLFCCPLSFLHLNSLHSPPLFLFLRFPDVPFFGLCQPPHGTYILLQRSMMLLHSTRTFPSGTLRR